MPKAMSIDIETTKTPVGTHSSQDNLPPLGVHNFVTIASEHGRGAGHCVGQAN